MNSIVNYQEEPITDNVHKIIEHWKNEEGNLIMIFHEIQTEYGYIPRNVAMFAADALNMSLASVYEVITFYNYFNLEAPAENTIAVCTGTACYLKGAEDIINDMKKEVSIKASESYSANRKYKVEEVRCVGCCGLAPVITFNGEIIGRVRPADIPTMIRKNSKR